MERRVARDRLPRVPRFYFHLYDDFDAPDDEGLEMGNLATARVYAFHLARFTAGETIKDHGHFVGDHRIDIENEEGAVLDTIYFRDAVEIRSLRNDPALAYRLQP